MPYHYVAAHIPTVKKMSKRKATPSGRTESNIRVGDRVTVKQAEGVYERRGSHGPAEVITGVQSNRAKTHAGMCQVQFLIGREAKGRISTTTSAGRWD